MVPSGLRLEDRMVTTSEFSQVDDDRFQCHYCGRIYKDIKRHLRLHRNSWASLTCECGHGINHHGGMAAQRLSEPGCRYCDCREWRPGTAAAHSAIAHGEDLRSVIFKDGDS